MFNFGKKFRALLDKKKYSNSERNKKQQHTTQKLKRGATRTHQAPRFSF
jgi:hypothetical protein